jgi:hypothetical protein
MFYCSHAVTTRLRAPATWRAQTRQLPLLTASEISEYAFCPQAWYLRRLGAAADDASRQRQDSGRLAHKHIGRSADRLRASERIQRALLLICAGLLVMMAVRIVSGVP